MIIGRLLVGCVVSGAVLAGEMPVLPLAEQCRVAYRHQNLPFLLERCPEEAWALARAQCEREADKVRPGFVEYCQQFYAGKAPRY